MLFIKKLLNTYENTEFFDLLVNLILVTEDIRPATLFETTDYKNYGNLDKIMDIFYSIINDFIVNGIKLIIEDDNNAFPRFLIYKKGSFVEKSINEDINRIQDDYYLGQYLGFQCVGHDYANYKKSRITVKYYVTKNSINFYYIVEVCEIGKISLDKLKKEADKYNNNINKVLNKYYLSSFYQIDINDGTDKRQIELEKQNINYIKNNIDKYINDFDNFYISGLSTFEQSIVYKNLINLTNLKLVSKVYTDMNTTDKYYKMYKNANTHEKILQVAKKILKLESTLKI